MEERKSNGQFAPGWSGGPGRPKKGTALTDILNAKLDKEELADLLIGKARGGDVVALKYIYDRIDGRPVETVNSNIIEAPKVIEIVHSTDTADPEDIEVMEE